APQGAQLGAEGRAGDAQQPTRPQLVALDVAQHRVEDDAVHLQANPTVDVRFAGPEQAGGGSRQVRPPRHLSRLVWGKAEGVTWRSSGRQSSVNTSPAAWMRAYFYTPCSWRTFPGQS